MEKDAKRWVEIVEVAKIERKSETSAHCPEAHLRSNAYPSVELAADLSEGEMSCPGCSSMSWHVGQIFQHPIRRTITETDNVWFTAITHNPALLHLDEEYCRENTEHGQRIVNSAFTLGLMVGISVGDTTLGTAVANLGWDEVRFPKPLFHGDTIRGDRGHRAS